MTIEILLVFSLLWVYVEIVGMLIHDVTRNPYDDEM